jgi:cell division protein FtsW (lipid II flippase)
MRSVLAYTAARIVLFVVALGIVYLAGARGLLALAIAVLASGLVSFVLLSRQRDAVSGVLVSRFRGFRQPRDRPARPGRLPSRLREFGQRIDEGTRAEDPD